MEEVQRLLREIEAHHIELQRQNEELRESQRQLEAYRDRYIDLYDFAPLGYVTLDEDGYVQEINLAGAKLLDADRDGLTGYAFSEYVATDSRAAFKEHVAQCVRERREVTTELHLVTRSGLSITASFTVFRLPAHWTIRSARPPSPTSRNGERWRKRFGNRGHSCRP